MVTQIRARDTVFGRVKEQSPKGGGRHMGRSAVGTAVGVVVFLGNDQSEYEHTSCSANRRGFKLANYHGLALRKRTCLYMKAHSLKPRRHPTANEWIYTGSSAFEDHQRSAFFMPSALKFYWAERIDSA